MTGSMIVYLFVQYVRVCPIWNANVRKTKENNINIELFKVEPDNH